MKPDLNGGSMSTALETAQDIVARDLDYICSRSSTELSRMAGKHVLITGGAGFLGYYLTQAIVQWNRSVKSDQLIRLTVYENFMRGAPAWFLSLADSGEIHAVKHNIMEPLPPNPEPFHFIIHAAGIASPIYYRAHPIETMDANVGGLRRLLDYCRHQKGSGHDVEGFLFFSSSEVYGDPAPEWIPTPETYRGYVSCTGPRACYDESKRFGETLCVTFAQQFDLPVRIARPFNNYGPGLKITDRRVIPDFARDVFAGRDIVLFSDGLPTRTFCYVADAVGGYLKLLVKGRGGEAYNIGTDGPEVSMFELARMIASQAADLFGYHGTVVRKEVPTQDYLADNPNRRCPVIDKARTELGYDPRITLEDGLRRTMIWYSGNLDAEEA
jgi:nucleoside-diphosphate-sugar epimerase